MKRDNILSSDLKNNLAYLKLVNDLFEGTIKIKNGMYLNKFELESEESFTERLRDSYLYNYFQKTILNLTSIILRKKYKLNLKDDKYKIIFENIDKKGSNLDVFLNECIKNTLLHGINYIWVDNVNNVSNTKNDKKFDTVFLKNIKRENVINYKIKNENGNVELEEIVIYDKNFELDINYKETEIEYLYFISKNDIKIYKDGTLINTIANNLGVVPVIPIYSNKTDFLKGSIPFLDLAYLNLKHYNLGSSLDNIIKLAGFPVPIIYTQNEFDKEAIKKNGVSIGVSQALVFGDKTLNGFEFVTCNSSSIATLQTNLEKIEDKMEKTSLSFLSNKSFATATEAKIADENSSSFLNELVNSLENGFNAAIKIFELFLNENEIGNIELNKDFSSIYLSDAQIAQLINLKNTGNISIETLWDSLKKGEVINIEDYNKEKQLIKDEKDSL